MLRVDGRSNDAIRDVQIEPNFVEYAEGSVLFSMGNTRVLCNTSIEEKLPRWIRDSGKIGGWITAEYGMLPRSTHTRTPREIQGLRGRTQEIRRLIGRSLRASSDLELLGERTCIVDCDVLQADAGTRTAAITGGYLSLALAFNQLLDDGLLGQNPLKSQVAAISVGLISNEPLIDLTYEEDSRAEVDLNIVMNGAGQFVEIQGTAEGTPFGSDQLEILLSLARKGVFELIDHQKAFLEEFG
jgi:ribonuclease PH